MSLYQRIMGHPFVYNTIRPLVVGIDLTPVYQRLEVSADDIVVDVGCGTGDALNYLTSFGAYHGFDTDPTAIAFAKKNWQHRANVHFTCQALGAADLAALKPTRLVMCGLLHHLADDDAVALLRMCGAAGTVKRMVTQDVIYLPGETINNVLARLDRGRHVRHLQAYLDLVAKSGMRLISNDIVRGHPSRGLAKYLVMVL